MILKLALCSLRFDKIISICIVASLCAVIAPLLLLFSLRFGIISNLEHKLSSNPSNLEIRMMSGYRLDRQFFDELSSNPHIGFVMPLTRSLSVTANISFNGKIVQNLETLPTGIGDPIVREMGLNGELSETEAYLSETTAQDLGLKVGDNFKFVISRITDNKTVNAVVPFTLKGIIKKELLPHKTILVNFNTLVYMEDYRDGFDPPVFSDGANPNTQRQTFAKARIYVKSLSDLEPVSRMLRQNYSITDKLASVENLKAISKVLSFIFTTIALTSIAGGVMATIGLIFTNLSRLEKTFALLFLSGMSKSGVFFIVIIQNFILSVCAYLCSLGLFYAGMFTFNLYFKDLLGPETLVSILTLSHVITGGILTVLICVAVSMVLCRFKVLNLKVADSLRNV
ncbi:putative ABC transport system permease protein [Succinivibrio dextrinosolvens]|uniref:ABC transporter permease n=1 Tax=Succinivibrio dextrinosolvens TaxID=83771 RepID=UPI0008ED4A76|nr:ABC transporter permease [Succinivibrio dextrinosolvens]SFS36597.1 putative ABC transport system permease protein [Succinivibrio dextrinosolvens]